MGLTPKEHRNNTGSMGFDLSQIYAQTVIGAELPLPYYRKGEGLVEGKIVNKYLPKISPSGGVGILKLRKTPRGDDVNLRRYIGRNVPDRLFASLMSDIQPKNFADAMHVALYETNESTFNRGGIKAERLGSGFTQYLGGLPGKFGDAIMSLDLSNPPQNRDYMRDLMRSHGYYGDKIEIGIECVPRQVAPLNGI